ncbi:hypothetical protein F3Y08_04915 [Proteus mirabilis]|uniref:hypothetical protein n=2 Tax=Proteus mirabilis TaxID=584 RepID=UPI00123D30DC|nr:hypothetical protein [Proteus mirabilis]QES77163.1 hypothetical protein F3Y08_04915 [Proteus mirabilis]
MTQDEQTLLMFKGMVAELPEQSRAKVEHCIAEINKLLAEYPDGEALLAVGYIGAEQQMKGNIGQE